MAGVKGRSGGHNAKTRKQLELEGTLRSGRHRDLKNPDPPLGKPLPPKALEGEALAEWHRMIVRLETSKTLSLVDDAILYDYCQMHATTEQIQKAVNGLTCLFFIKVGFGGAEEPKTHPMVVQLRQYRLALRVFLVEFGLTPASRGRVKATGEGDKPEDPFAEFEDEASKETH